ncbi:MAG: hypothetical protein P1V20_17575 [Verrucomicrobiales bacterium]|nr:hypothetical protein [Verrucomicrobiales bacterium]
MIRYDQEEASATEAERFNKVIEWLERRRAHIAAHVLQMGEIHFNDVVDTAGVRVTGSQVDLFFNREFFEELKLVELVAVLLHESLHVVFRHQARAEKIESNWTRRLFSYGCETVINDSILRYFKEIELPPGAITGQSLLGRDTSDLTAEQVMALLQKKSHDDPCFLEPCLDDHDVWDPEEPGDESPEEDLPHRWDANSDKLVERLEKMNSGLKLWGSKALGATRLAVRKKGRTDLRRFLTEQLRPAHRYATVWSVPNRKAMSIYPDVILPGYEPESWMVRVLMAIDSSGSVSDEFLGVARAVANQQLPGTKMKMISFDTRTYEVEPGATTLKGGGGTDAQAVESYIEKELPAYPDYVFIFSDGYTPTPDVKNPDRWIWLLPPYGVENYIPKGSKIYRFDPREL